MTSRILPVDEWPRLEGTLLGGTWQHLDPSRSFVMVTEEGDQLVSCVLLYSAWHLEAVWVHPSYRHNIAVGRSMLKIVKEQIDTVGVDEILTMSVEKGVEPLGVRLGSATKLDGDHYAVKVA